MEVRSYQGEPQQYNSLTSGATVVFRMTLESAVAARCIVGTRCFAVVCLSISLCSFLLGDIVN